MAQKRSKRQKKCKARQKALARRRHAKQSKGKTIIEYDRGGRLARQLLLAEWMLGEDV